MKILYYRDKYSNETSFQFIISITLMVEIEFNLTKTAWAVLMKSEWLRNIQAVLISNSSYQSKKQDPYLSIDDKRFYYWENHLRSTERSRYDAKYGIGQDDAKRRDLNVNFKRRNWCIALPCVIQFVSVEKRINMLNYQQKKPHEHSDIINACISLDDEDPDFSLVHIKQCSELTRITFRGSLNTSFLMFTTSCFGGGWIQHTSVNGTTTKMIQSCFRGLRVAI